MFSPIPQPTPSASQAMLLNAVIAFIIVLMFALISIDGNPEQEAFNRGAIFVILGVAMIHAGICFSLHARRLRGARARFFLRFGSLMNFAALALYFAVASTLAGRVL